MRLIGLKVERMDSSIQKVLNPGWYPFGDYKEPDSDGFLSVKPVTHLEKSLYRLRKYQPEVSVSCVVGMNGSGKSTILEVIFRILNNLAVRQCSKMNPLLSTEMEYAYGVFADLYCECDRYIYWIKCRDDNLICYKYRNTAKSLPLLEEDKNPVMTLNRLFYTIGVNYSLYSFGQESFKSVSDKRINGNWLTGVFHKNDGYLAPLTLVPYRENGEISMAKENELAMQRITALSILSKAKGKQFPEGYYPYQLHLSLNLDYEKTKRESFKKSYQAHCPWIELDKLIDMFQVAWEDLFKELNLKIKRSKNSDEYKLALFYLAYKSSKISLTYNDYYLGLEATYPQRLYEEKKQVEIDNFINGILPQNIKKIADRLYDIDDHITLKIHQTINFLTGTYWSAEGGYQVSMLLTVNAPEDYDDVVKILPPPFYNLDVTFEKAKKRAGRWHKEDTWQYDSSWGDEKRDSFRLSSMSSGEKQVLVAISYVLYHIKNLQSVGASQFRIPYHHICVVFDEVELYFHPDYQRRFLSMLIESFSWTKIDRRRIRSIHILIATHSPFVLTDVLTERTLYLKEGKRMNVEAQTFGGNYYDLLDNSFFFEKTAIGEISARATRRWVRHHNDINQPALSDEVLGMVGDPFVRNYLQLEHYKKTAEDVQAEKTD